MATTAGMPERSAAADIGDRIGFARHIFDNYQALIRSVDTKAGALLGLALFFAASIFPISKDAVSRVRLGDSVMGLFSGAFLVSSASFLLFFLLLVGALGRVIKPRGARFYKGKNDTTNLLWQEHIVSFPENGSYFAAVSTASPSMILRNLTDQIFELANISREKMGAINSGFRLLYCLAISWITNVISGLVLVGWKQ